MSGVLAVSLFLGVLAIGAHFLVKEVTKREAEEKLKPKILG
jgi:hypothetical protein